MELHKWHLPGNKLPGKYPNPGGVKRVPKGLESLPSILIGGIVLILLITTITTHAQDTNESPIWPDQFYAPYIYAGSLPLAYMEEQTGVRYYTLAFMLSRVDKCLAAWQGGMPIASENLIAPELEKLRAKGGEVIVSFGGWAGEELARICTDVESLTAQYQSVIDAYSLTWLDFDIEGGEIHEGDSVARR
jgi:hypothetical protein